MAHRAIVPHYEQIMSQNTTGVFAIVAPVFYIDDTNTHPTTGHIAVNFTFTQTAAQIQTAIINEIIALGGLMGFTVAAASNQIIIPSVQKV